MRTLNYDADLCVIGGGLSGLCCALAAARNGIKTVLVHDRAVLGGNASEEIRMWICGAHGTDNRETGILEEIVLENFYQNPHSKYPIWSSVLYEKAVRQENLTLLLNSSCMEAKTDTGRIVSIKAWQSNAETFHVVHAKFFADCSGDSILSELSGAEYMYGREAKNDFGESIPPETADKKTMGMSCLFQIRETEHKCEFIPPEWAYVYETDGDLPLREHDPSTNYWWIEVGGEGDCLHDTDTCRDELIKICYGVWDHIKNRGEHGMDNWELEWIGFLPGKRESRRYVGKYIITQNDVESGGHFDDIAAYGGWSMDDHFPAGFYHRGSYPTVFHPAPSPWGIPLRSMISKNVKNLVFAGRNISVTHAALSSSRVMATCAMCGQALGTAVAAAVHENCAVENIDVPNWQKKLMHDDCFLPGKVHHVPELTEKACSNAEIVRNGAERGADNLWFGKDGDYLEYSFGADEQISEIRLVFDSDLNRDYHNMPCVYPLNETRYKLPCTLIKEYRIELEDSAGNVTVITEKANRKRLAVHNVNTRACKVRFVPVSTHGAGGFRVFSFEIA